MVHALRELVRQGQDHRGERVLVIRFDLKNVEADAFRFCRLVQQTVPLGLRQRRRNGVLREGFELVHLRLLFVSL